MRTARIVVFCLGLALSAPRLAAQTDAHGSSPPAGSHPRLILSASEVAAAQAKVNAPNTWSNALMSATLASTSKINLSGPNAPPYLFYDAIYASQPMLALLASSDSERQDWARSAINSSLATVRAFDPPYPDSPEWWGRYLYRYVALTYDATYDRMTQAERAELQEEMQRIAASIAAAGIEANPNNHTIVQSVDLALTAMALDGDVPQTPRTIADEPVVRLSSTPPGDFLKYRSGFVITRVGAAPGGNDWHIGVDFDQVWIRKDANPFDLGYSIVWRAGHGPAPGATYYVTYDFTPEIAAWKDRARMSLQRNLDNLWSDGASSAGIFYGSWTMSWMLDAFEAYRRVAGYDFSQHPAARDAVLWHPSELIAPLPGTTCVLRINNRNDGTYDELDDTVAAGAPTYWTWVLSRYRNDPGNRDKVAYWLLQHTDRWTDIARWREALWVNDDLSGPPPLAPAPPLSIPLSRFFMGHNLANLRTGSFDGPANDWALFSFAAGPYSAVEHNHADRGAFTFNALGEDFAIDSGYAFSSPTGADSTPGHNYLLVDRPQFSGTSCTVLYRTDRQDVQGGASIRSRVLSQTFDAVDADLKTSYVATPNLPFVGSPACWPVGTADRSVVFLKRPDHAPFAVVSDSLDVDGTARQATWQLHTAAGNTIAITGPVAAVTGSHTGAFLNVYLYSPATMTLSQDTFSNPSDPSVGTHPRLLARATSTNARFLAVLVPEKAFEMAPLSVLSQPASGSMLVTVSGGGLTDAILQNRTSGGAISAGGLETDGSLAVVRTDAGGALVAWLVQNASYLRRNGADLWSVNAPAGTRGSAAFDGTALSVTANDATDFRAYAPGATGFDGPNGTIAAPHVGNLLHWAASKRLLDTSPAGSVAFFDDFSSSVPLNWISYPLTKARYEDRIVSGELCSQGDASPFVSISRTKRTFSPLRADTFQSPRNLYGDAIQSGELTVQPGSGGGSVWILGRVVDHSIDGVPYPLPWPNTVDQDFVKVDLPIGTSGTTSVKVRNIGLGGLEQTLCSGPGSAPAGQKVSYDLSIQGSTVGLSLNGALVCSATDTSGAISAAGYFEWQVARLEHVHFDNVRVTLPGSTYACTENAECGTCQLCNLATHTCGPYPDNDGDGWSTCSGDCDDTDPTVHPGATELCGDGIDQDCDGLWDPECCQTINIRGHQCLICDSTGETVCGPGYRYFCCP